MSLCSVLLSLETPNEVRFIEYLIDKQKVLIRLSVWAGWSEPLLVAHITLLKISCRGSYVFMFAIVFNTGLSASLSSVTTPEPRLLKKSLFRLFDGHGASTV